MIGAVILWLVLLLPYVLSVTKINNRVLSLVLPHLTLVQSYPIRLNMQFYLFPCKSKSASAQVDQMVAAVASNLYGMIWLDIEINTSPGCGWGTDYESSCKFVEELISRIKYHGKVPGIYASSYMWQSIMGGVSKCPSVASAPLWYAHYDKSPSFSDFKPFGGWTKPNIKQFEGTSSLCGASVDKNYYP